MYCPKVVITMTSYPKRINYVAKRIYNFITNQTDNYDIFYLWLAESDFPNLENDLPIELIKICKFFDIKIKWIKDNEYCHKRWYVYPEHFNDIVISIDDDSDYNKNVIKYAKSVANTKAIYNLFQNKTCYTIYQGINFIRYENTTDERPSIYKTFLGQCIFTPGTFPLEAITPENLLLRKKYCPICDESWLNPFIKYNEVKIGSIPVYQDEIAEISQINKTYDKMKQMTRINASVQDLYVLIVLKLFPKLYEHWIYLFPSYKEISKHNSIIINDIYDKYSADDLLSIIKETNK